VPFPRFGLQLKEGQSAEEFMDEKEKKVNAMIGESMMNEYKAYKNLVKHKNRINCVLISLWRKLLSLSSPRHQEESSHCCCGQFLSHTSQGPQRKILEEKKS
jgi:hypothetical protein